MHTILPLLLILQEPVQEEAKGGLLSLHGGLMFWTLAIFLVLIGPLSRRILYGAGRGLLRSIDKLRCHGRPAKHPVVRRTR